MNRKASVWNPWCLVGPAKVFDREMGFGARVASGCSRGLGPAGATMGGRARTAASKPTDRSEPVRIMSATDSPWNTGPWKPAWRYPENDRKKMLVFFDGVSRKHKAEGIPFAFTLGCLELERLG